MNRRYLSIICLIFTLAGCSRTPSHESDGALFAERLPDIRSKAVIGSLLTEYQMDMLVAGQGCFGLVEGHESCCDWVRTNFTWLWSFHLAGTAEAVAAHIEGRESGRCF